MCREGDEVGRKEEERHTVQGHNSLDKDPAPSTPEADIALTEAGQVVLRVL